MKCFLDKTLNEKKKKKIMKYLGSLLPIRIHNFLQKFYIIRSS